MCRELLDVIDPEPMGREYLSAVKREKI